MSASYKILSPLLMKMDPERAHRLTLCALAHGIGPTYVCDDPSLGISAFGIRFANPLGLAAGFDKDAEVLRGLLGLGFGFVEAGTVTPKPQDGNPRPRVFRDVQNRSVINRMGFPGRGVAYFSGNMERFRARHTGIIGINIGINKDAPSPVDDYKYCIDNLARYADYITINVSSPNTAGLRDLQARDALDNILSQISCPVPLLLKIAPDLEEAARVDIAELALRHKLSGLIVSNTTVRRPDALDEKLRTEKGGLSGALLRDQALETLAAFYRLTGGRVPLVGVGGISSAQDAYDRIRAGATLLQVYTGLVFHGPALVRDILTGLPELMAKDGFTSIADAVGTGKTLSKDVA